MSNYMAGRCRYGGCYGVPGDLCGHCERDSLRAGVTRLRALLRRVLFEVQLPIALKEEIEKEVGDGDKS